MLGTMHLTAEADLLVAGGPVGYGKLARPNMLNPVERWESALQRMAEAQVSSWRRMAKPHTAVCHTSRAKSGAHTSSRDTAGKGQATQDSQRGRFWLLASCACYGAPACASVMFLAVLWRHIVRIFSLWLMAEVIFMMYRYLEHRRVSQQLILNPVPSCDYVERLLDRILGLREDVDAAQFLSGWFLGAPVDKIRRGNMQEFLAYALYHRSYDELSGEYQLAIREHIVRAEDVWGLQFNDGYEPGLSFMAHNREPLRTLHHPLFLYVWGHSVSILSGLAMRLLGFGSHRSPDGLLCYWYRPALPKGAQSSPRVFIHGLGVGITPYLGFIAMLLDGHKGACVVVELPHIALQLYRKIPTTETLVTAIQSIHERHELGMATYVGHSYGSLLIACLVRRAPHLVSSLGLVDPVCFLLCLPDVVYNFVYRTPGGDSLRRALSDWARWFFCSKELQVAQVLCRGFDWHTLHLWADQVPAQTAVMLAGHDNIVPARHVRIYLEKNGVKVIYNEDYQHAEYLFRPTAQRTFLQALESCGPGSA